MDKFINIGHVRECVCVCVCFGVCGCVCVCVCVSAFRQKLVPYEAALSNAVGVVIDVPH